MRKNLWILAVALFLLVGVASADLEIEGDEDEGVIELRDDEVATGGNASWNQTFGDANYWRLDGTNAPPTADWDMGGYGFSDVNDTTFSGDRYTFSSPADVDFYGEWFGTGSVKALTWDTGTPSWQFWYSILLPATKTVTIGNTDYGANGIQKTSGQFEVETLDAGGDGTIIQNQLEVNENTGVITMSLPTVAQNIDAENITADNITASGVICDSVGCIGSGAGNPFDQSLNTTDSPVFKNLTVNDTGTSSWIFMADSMIKSSNTNDGRFDFYPDDDLTSYVFSVLNLNVAGDSGEEMFFQLQPQSGYGWLESYAGDGMALATGTAKPIVFAPDREITTEIDASGNWHVINGSVNLESGIDIDRDSISTLPVGGLVDIDAGDFTGDVSRPIMDIQGDNYGTSVGIIMNFILQEYGTGTGYVMRGQVLQENKTEDLTDFGYFIQMSPPSNNADGDKIMYGQSTTMQPSNFAGATGGTLTFKGGYADLQAVLGVPASETGIIFDATGYHANRGTVSVLDLGGGNWTNVTAHGFRCSGYAGGSDTITGVTDTFDSDCFYSDGGDITFNAGDLYVGGSGTFDSGNGQLVSTNAGGSVVAQTEDGNAGYISFGNTADIGISTDGVVGTYDYDGGMIFKQKTSNPDEIGEFIWIEENGNWRFALPSSGVDHATYNPRSMIIAGSSVNNASNFLCSYWGFDELSCDTSKDGADLGVQNNLQVLGSVYPNCVESEGIMYWQENSAPTYGGYQTISGGLNQDASTGRFVPFDITITEFNIRSRQPCDCVEQQSFNFTLQNGTGGSNSDITWLNMDDLTFNETEGLSYDVNEDDELRIYGARGGAGACTLGTYACDDVEFQVVYRRRCS